MHSFRSLAERIASAPILMAKYSGKAVTVNRPAGELFDTVSNLNSFQQRLDSMPEEIRAKLGDVHFDADSMTINAPGVGNITFSIVERVAPSLLRLASESSPVPFNIIMNFNPVDANTTEVKTDLDVEIPMMLRPLVGGKLQEAADRFGDMFSNFFAG